MDLRKEQEENPYLLFLGAGASIPSGGASMDELIEKFLLESNLATPLTLEKMNKNERFERFVSGMDNLDEISRYTWLRLVFKYGQPSDGYIALARLLEAGYFNVVLTTNWDSFLDISLNISTKMTNNRDYRFYARGVTQDYFIATGFRRFATPRIKILKLHGELYSPVIFVTKNETANFPNELRDLLKGFFQNYSVIMVGYSLLDEDVQACIEQNDNTLVYVNPQQPDVPSFQRCLSKFKNVLQVDEQNRDFDVFMITLVKLLLNEDIMGATTLALSADTPKGRLSQINANAKKILDSSDWLIRNLKNQQ